MTDFRLCEEKERETEGVGEERKENMRARERAETEVDSTITCLHHLFIFSVLAVSLFLSSRSLLVASCPLCVCVCVRANEGCNDNRFQMAYMKSFGVATA